MKYPLISCDVDGTLINDQFIIPQNCVEAIQAYRTQGGLFCLNTGRDVGAVWLYAQQLGLLGHKAYLATNHGATLYDCHQQAYLFVKPLIREVALGMIKDFLGLDYHLLVYTLNDIVINKQNLFFETLLKFEQYPKGANYQPDLLGYFAANPNLEIIRVAIMDHGLDDLLGLTKPATFPTASSQIPFLEKKYGERIYIINSGTEIEIVAPGVSKAGLLQLICEIEKIPREKSVAFGDSTGDLSMLKACGKPFVVGGLDSPIKDAGTVIGSNDGNALSQTILDLAEDKID